MRLNQHADAAVLQPMACLARPMRRGGVRGLLAAACVLCGGLGHAAESDLGDVYQAVVEFRLDISSLQYTMGDPPPQVTKWSVVEAAPRHVFWQAQILYRSANQLAEEVAGQRMLRLPAGSWRRSQPRPAPEGFAIRPENILQVVTDAGDHVRALMGLQNIQILNKPRIERERAKTLADMLTMIVEANRQLDALLHREVLPRHAYNRVMAAVDRAGDLLGGRYPVLGELETGRRPRDAYRRLIGCLELLHTAERARRIGGTLILDWDRELAREQVSNVDVYHLATAVLADLDFLTKRLGTQATKVPKGEYEMPRFVFPSHIHQLAGVLEAQLRLLATTPAADAGNGEDATPG